MPLLFKQENPLMGVWQLEETSGELLPLLSHPAWYEPTLQQFALEKRRCEWLACRVLLKELLGKELPVSYYPNGAPYVEDFSGTISFSHTKGYVAVLVSDKAVAGIDIECQGVRALKMRHRFMNEAELASSEEEAVADYALLHWCAKETIFKMIGQKEVDFREHLHISPFRYATQGSFEVQETRTSSRCTYRLHFYLTPEFALTWSE